MNLPFLLRNSTRLRTLQFCKLNLCTKAVKSNFTPVYRFPYIRAIGLINKLKFYQTGLTIAAVPSSIILGSLGVISADSIIITFIIGVTGTITLFLLGLLPNKFVGYVYISDDNETVKLAYVDFWGRRKDIEVPLIDIVPLSDLPAIPTDQLFLTLRRFSKPDTYKLNLKYGIVLEKNKFNTIFLQDIKK